MTRKATTQRERLAVIETEIKQIKDDIGEIKTSFKEYIENESKRQTNLKKELKKEFAGRWVEKGYWGLIGIILALTVKLIFGG